MVAKIMLLCDARVRGGSDRMIPRSSDGNEQIVRDPKLAVVGGSSCLKTSPCAARQVVFSLDIPFYRTPPSVPSGFGDRSRPLLSRALMCACLCDPKVQIQRSCTLNPVLICVANRPNHPQILNALPAHDAMRFKLEESLKANHSTHIVTGFFPNMAGTFSLG